MLKFISLIFIILFLVMGMTIGVLNPETVNFNLFILNLELPLSVVIALHLVIGMLAGAFIIFLQVIKLRWTVRMKTRENQKLSDQIIQLKKADIKAKESLRKDSSALVSIEKQS